VGLAENSMWMASADKETRPVPIISVCGLLASIADLLEDRRRISERSKQTWLCIRGWSHLSNLGLMYAMRHAQKQSSSQHIVETAISTRFGRWWRS